MDVYMVPFAKPDTNVRMEIDIKNETLTYYVNGQNQGVLLQRLTLMD